MRAAHTDGFIDCLDSDRESKSYGAKHPSFMHTAQLSTLEQVVAFHARGENPAGAYPGKPELSRLDLGEQEQADLVAFLRALDGPGPDAALLHRGSVQARC